MLRIEEYLLPDKLAELCRKMDMPEEVADEVVQNAANCDFSLVGDAFERLFSVETGKAAIDWIEAQYHDSAASLKPLTVYLAAVLHTYELYEAWGIGEQIFYDTVKSFTRFVREHKVSFGFYGFDRGFWMYRCLSGVLFRIGTLEFEMVISNDEYKKMFKFSQGTVPMISVHIPSDSQLTREEIDASYSNAKVFFRRYFPNFEYQVVYCRSWLLSPVLQQLLPATSKILAFQSDFRILAWDENNDSAITWIFKRKYDDWLALPETTTLERNAKKHLIAGNHIGSALGVLQDSKE